MARGHRQLAPPSCRLPRRPAFPPWHVDTGKNAAGRKSHKHEPPSFTPPFTHLCTPAVLGTHAALYDRRVRRRSAMAQHHSPRCSSCALPQAHSPRCAAAFAQMHADSPPPSACADELRLQLTQLISFLCAAHSRRLGTARSCSHRSTRRCRSGRRHCSGSSPYPQLPPCSPRLPTFPRAGHTPL